MNKKENEVILNKLLNATTADEVDFILRDEKFFSNLEWIPIGGRNRESNAGLVEGQMKHSENAFVEKITNSIDAILMKKCEERGIDPKDKERAPKSLQEAISEFIGAEEDFNKLRKEHSDIIITAEGKKELPTLTIIDRGEGQEPSRLQTTILGLSNRIKADVPFVYGKYHQGGSASLRFAGSKPRMCYQLVLSKRASSLNPLDRDWGFSLIRKTFLGAGDKVALYQYCIDKEDKILTIPESFENPFTYRNKIDFPDGTLIKIYDYQLTKATSIVYGLSSLAEEINKKLLKPAVPIHLKELRREYAEGRTAKSTEYTIGGFLRLIQSQKELISEEFSIPADLGPLGKKNIQFIILKHVSTNPGVKTYKDRKEKIFYLDNGLSLNNQSVGFISDICRLPNLADYILCFIDISDVSPAQTNIFHSSREEFADTQDYRDLKEKLKIVFEDPKFLELQREYKNKDILNTQILDKDTDKLLEKALKDDSELLKDLELGDDLQITDTENPIYPELEKEKYSGKYLPTFFELIGSPQREINRKSFIIVSFKTDAVDDFLDRVNDQGACDPPTSNLFSIIRRTPKNGVISFRIQPRENVDTGEEEELSFGLEVPSRNFKRVIEVKIKVIPDEIFLGEEYPSFIDPLKDTLKIPLKEVRKIGFKTDADNNFLSQGKGTVSLSSDSLEQVGVKLRNGLIYITVKCIATAIGVKDDIKIDFNCNNGTHFPLVIHLEVIEDKGSEGFKKPGMTPVCKSDWGNRGWDETDIAEVVKDIDGLTVFYNDDSKCFDLIKNMIRTEDIPLAKNKYISDCYIQSLHLYFEFRNETGYKDYVRRAMRALGKSMPTIISRNFRS